MAAHQAPLSLGFSRQEHWSGLPFLSPMHESESEVAQSCPTLSDPMDCSPLSMRFCKQGYWSGLPFPSPGDLPNPGIEPGSPALQADALPSEPPQKYNIKTTTATTTTKQNKHKVTEYKIYI